MSDMHVVHKATPNALLDGTNAGLDINCMLLTVAKLDFSENVMLGFSKLSPCFTCLWLLLSLKKKLLFLYLGVAVLL